jgi:outer membrane protein OmpA-like peptidoglycan-associated protein
MFAKYVVAAFIGTGALGTLPALAEPTVKSDQIVEYFVKAKLGAERGLCVGTVQECEQNARKQASLDMLINFDLDSAELTEEARQNLAEFARAIKDDKLSTARFVVEGYTDGRGTEQYNLGLSERRAQAVTKFLYEQGIPQDRVTAVGMGMANPRVPDLLDPINRRVEMRIQTQ